MKPGGLCLVVALCIYGNQLVNSLGANDTMSQTAITAPQQAENIALIGQMSNQTRDNVEANSSLASADASLLSVNTSDANSTVKVICNDTIQKGKDVDCDEDPVPHPYQSSVGTAITYVGFISVPLFLAMSLCGNFLTLIVMFSKMFWNSPCSLLLIALALSDSTYSIVFPFSKLFVRDLIGYDPRALTENGCHLFFIVHKASKMCSSWFIVAICVERFIAVWFPFKAKIICSKRNTSIVVLVITIGMLIFTGFWTFSTKIVNGICVPNYATPENAFLARAYLIAGSAVFSVIPAAILIILTPLICIKLHQQNRFRQTVSKQNSGNGSAATQRANAMLLAVTIAYIVLVTPTAIAHNVCFTLQVNFYESKHLSMAIARAILQVMEQLNFSINFWLYIMCNQSFRNRALAVLRLKNPEKGSSFRTTRNQSGMERTASSNVTTPG